MAVPRNRHSVSRRNMKRSHMALKKSHPTRCANCAEWKAPHRACPSCGVYRDRKVVKTDASDE